MKIKALKSWNSLTRERDVKPGDELEVADARGRQLVKDGRAEEVQAKRKAAAKKTTPKKSRRKKS